MKKTISHLLLLCFISVYNYSHGQNEKIIFEYHHSMRIPFSDVIIEISRVKNKAQLTVNSKAANNDERWKYSNIQSDSIIRLVTFKELQNKLRKLETENIPKDQSSFSDGYSCSIRMISKNKSYNYHYNCPNHDTEERQLKTFLQLCQDIIITAGLKPDEIFAHKGKKH